MIEATIRPIETVKDDSDDRLVQASLHDSREFTELYRRYVDRVYRYLYSRVGNPLDAEDLTSQVFIEALQNLHRYRPGSNFAAWLFTIAYRRKIDAYRNDPSTVPLIEEVITQDEDGLLDQTIQHDALYQLDHLLASLKKEDQELLRQHFAAGLTYGQIAKILHRSEGAIKMAMSRLIRRMRVQWKEKP